MSTETTKGSAIRYGLVAVTTVALLIGFAVIRTVRFESLQAAVKATAAATIPNTAAGRLAGAIRIPTVSHEDPAAFNAEAFQALHSYLAAEFPKVHANLKREAVATHSLLYTWKGRDLSLKPILLLGHLDVVPVESGTEDEWRENPFAGRIADGFIWGRGSIDNKSAILGTMEAVEMLLADGFQPLRTVYLAYGHDEEVGGRGGAREISALLKSRGVAVEMVLDEGGVIGDGILPGLSSPVALVGVAEKGFVSVELSARDGGGHSSLPPAQSTIGILSAAIARLEANPMAARLDGPTRQLFEAVAPAFPIVQRAAFANLWLTRPLVMHNLQDSPTTNAMVRTTMAATIFQAGTKDNVLASTARAVVNFRILPGDTVGEVLEHVRDVIDDNRVEVRVAGRFSAEPSAVSSTDSESFQRLERTIRSVVPEAIVAPYLVVVATDARYYASLSENIFRFLPLRIKSEDLKRMHGADERISIRNYEDAIRMYRELFLDFGGS